MAAALSGLRAGMVRSFSTVKPVSRAMPLAPRPMTISLTSSPNCSFLGGTFSCSAAPPQLLTVTSHAGLSLLVLLVVSYCLDLSSYGSASVVPSARQVNLPQRELHCCCCRCQPCHRAEGFPRQGQGRSGCCCRQGGWKHGLHKARHKEVSSGIFVRLVLSSVRPVT
jgi:hypothetical protein